MKNDFDYLKQLYKTDKEEFKRVTDDMITALIDKAPAAKQKKLKIDQWQLEQELKKIKNPIERMNKMVTIFWLGVDKFVKTTQNTDRQIKNIIADDVSMVKQSSDNNVVFFNNNNKNMDGDKS